MSHTFFTNSLRPADFNQAWKEIENASAGWLVAAFLFNLSILLVWTSLWSVLIPKAIFVSFPNLFQANSFMSTSCNSLPFPGGHAVGLVLFARLAKIKHSVALSVLALDQMLEGIVKVVVLTLAASFSPLPETNGTKHSSFYCIDRPIYRDYVLRGLQNSKS